MQGDDVTRMMSVQTYGVARRLGHRQYGGGGVLGGEIVRVLAHGRRLRRRARLPVARCVTTPRSVRPACSATTLICRVAKIGTNTVFLPNIAIF